QPVGPGDGPVQLAREPVAVGCEALRLLVGLRRFAHAVGKAAHAGLQPVQRLDEPGARPLVIGIRCLCHAAPAFAAAANPSYGPDNNANAAARKHPEPRPMHYTPLIDSTGEPANRKPRRAQGPRSPGAPAPAATRDNRNSDDRPRT